MSFPLQCKPNTLTEKGEASTHEHLGECGVSRIIGESCPETEAISTRRGEGKG